MDGIYRFLVRGHLDNCWSTWLGELAIDHTEDGCSVLTGRLPDQAALHGVIAQIRDLGLPLLAVESAAGCENTAGTIQPGARGSPLPDGDGNEAPTHIDGPATRLITLEGDRLCD